MPEMLQNFPLRIFMTVDSDSLLLQNNSSLSQALLCLSLLARLGIRFPISRHLLFFGAYCGNRPLSAVVLTVS